jgi:hypothetical protein
VSNPKVTSLTLLACAALVCGCRQQGTPKPGEGAAGFVNQPGAAAAVNPTNRMGGGMAGQTPAYGQVGGVPSKLVEGDGGSSIVQGSQIESPIPTEPASK